MSVAISNPALIPPGGLAGPSAPAAARPGAPGGRPDGGGASAANGPSFSKLLHDASGAAPLQFSKHALARVQKRGITLDPSTLGRLQEGVGRAAGKGARDSVVLVDGTAFVVSVNNRTVVTAVGSEHMREHVFTNIDSAVIA
jgi:flagellar operon protein